MIYKYSDTPRIFYSHYQLIYNKRAEMEETYFLISHFWNWQFICPNFDIGESNDFQDYLQAVAESDKIVFSEYKNAVSKGVYGECSFALSRNIPVFVLRKNIKGKFYMKEVIGFNLHPTPKAYNYATAILKKPNLKKVVDFNIIIQKMN